MKDITGWDKCPNFSPTFDDRACFYYLEQHDGRVCGLCKKEDTYRCISEVGKLPIPLSHSAVQDFLSCHKLFYYKHILGLSVKNYQMSSAVKMGALWDRALQFALGNKDVDMQGTVDDYNINAFDVEKVRALYKAYRDLGIKVDDGYELQARIDMELEFPEHWVWGNGEEIKLAVRGFYDRKYPTYFVENKLSGRPDAYLDPFIIQAQVGTYFLADPKMESCIMEVVRTPGMKQTKADGDDPVAFGKRVYDDIMNRPSHYFIGYSVRSQTYGKRYYRGEFDLDELMGRYKHIFREIHEAALLNGFYMNDKSCNNLYPGISCDFIGVCRYGNASEDMYEIRRKDIE